jgi:plastocyanin
MQTLWTLLTSSYIVPGSPGDKRSVEMVNRTTGIIVGTALAVAVALSSVGRADDKEKNAVQNATVHFGQHQPQTPDPAPVGAAVTHFLDPNEVTIHKGGTVTFVVNGGGHGIAIHQVSKNTTREDIAEDLCDGTNNETPDASVAQEIADRRARAAVCNGAVPETAVINGAVVSFLGSQNLDYMITDGKGHLVIEPGFNADGAINPRLDDPDNSARVLATSGASPGDTANPAALANNRAGAFLTGSAAPATPGNRIQVEFMKTGRFLVICMNRGHSLNDHMFGFVNVVDDGEDK